MANIRNFSNSIHGLATLVEKITSAATPVTSPLSASQLQNLQTLATRLRQNPSASVPQTGTLTFFTGPDSAAKLAAAQMLANNLDRDLYRIDLAVVASKYVGETSNALAQLLHSPAAHGALLFFDEADALFGKRTNVQDSHDKYANQSAGVPHDNRNLLQLLQQYPGVIILAVNSTDGCDPALLVRAHASLKFPPTL